MSIPYWIGIYECLGDEDYLYIREAYEKMVGLGYQENIINIAIGLIAGWKREQQNNTG